LYNTSGLNRSGRCSFLLIFIFGGVAVLDQKTKRTSASASYPRDRDHWFAKVVFALLIATLVAAELAMQCGVQLLPDNWP
jgi:hypothetical protein